MNYKGLAKIFCGIFFIAIHSQDFKKEYWENIYLNNESNKVSWYRKKPNESLDLICSLSKDKKSSIIDIGGGDSNLVDNLLNLGYENISVLDISKNALVKSQKRLGDFATKVTWIESDITNFITDNQFFIWHDRAVFHFLTSPTDIAYYVQRAEKYIGNKGYLILATFSENGPKKCSGLDIQQYPETQIKKIFSQFELLKCFNQDHKTPFNTTQNFNWFIFQKK